MMDDPKNTDLTLMDEFIAMAGVSTACTIDEETYPNKPEPVAAPDQPKAG